MIFKLKLTDESYLLFAVCTPPFKCARANAEDEEGGVLLGSDPLRA
jgi:hypothetical protein